MAKKPIQPAPEAAITGADTAPVEPIVGGVLIDTPAPTVAPAAMPSIGRIVHYRLSADDAKGINAARAASLKEAKAKTGTPGAVSHRQVMGNLANEGDTVAAIIVQVWGVLCVNLQAILDGNDSYWLTSRNPGDGPGQWSWPPRV